MAHTAWVKSPTWDEPGYLGLGAYLLTHGGWDVPGAGSHPPLAFYLQSVPFFLGYSLDEAAWRYPPGTDRDLSFVRAADVVRGNAILLDRRYDGEALLWWCRLSGLVAAALLWVAVWTWASRLHGTAGGLLGLACVCLSPNLLAHASLATTDFTLAATYVAAFWALRHCLRRPTPVNLVVAGLAGGLALASKLSALLWAPTVAVLLAVTAAAGPRAARAELARLAPLGGRRPRPWAGAAVAGVVLASVAVGTVWALYGFRLAPYATVVSSQLWDLSSGHQAYLLGRFSTTGWRYYFPVAFLVKTPLPLLTLAGAGALVTLRRDPWEAALLGLPPALFLAAFTLSTGKDIGLRYLLPVYPFMGIAAGALAHGWAGQARWRRRAVLGLVLALAATTARIHPDHLAYFNELAGGPDGGYRVLADSNLDWGQDLKGLKRWMDAHGLRRVKLSYFGSVDPALYELDYDWLPSYRLPRRGTDAVELPTTGWIAISVTNRVGLYMDQYGYGHGLYDWLDGHEPVARIGHSIWVYDLADTP